MNVWENGEKWIKNSPKHSQIWKKIKVTCFFFIWICNFNSFQQSCATYSCRNRVFLILHESFFFFWILQLIILTHGGLFHGYQQPDIPLHSFSTNINNFKEPGWRLNQESKLPDLQHVQSAHSSSIS